MKRVWWALHSAAPARYRRLVEVLEQPETLEIATARDAFRALIRSVTVTARAASGHDVTVETELAPLVSAGPVGGIKSLGAGTRNQRFLRLAEFRQRAA